MFIKDLYRNPYICYIEDPAESSKSMSLEEAITNATKDLAKEETTEETPVKKDEPKEKETPEKSDEKDEEESLDPKEAKKAIALMRMINDPKTSRETIALLAKQIGLTADSTKTETKEAIKDLKTIFKESLGPDLDFMSDKLYDAIDKITDSLVDSKTKEIRETVAEQQKTAQMNALETAYDKVMGGYENSSELVSEISKLQEDVRPGKNMTPEAYFKMLLVTAASNKDIDLKKVSSKETPKGTKDNIVSINKDKLNKARNDANSRIASDRSGDTKEDSSTPEVNKLSDAIRIAMEQENAKAK
jgi:hypothetical protein